jgi:hypothetical protein
MTPKVKKQSLERGDWMHQLLEAHFQEWAGVDTEGWRGVQARLTHQFEELFEEERDELGDMPGDCERLFRSYLRFWRQDLDRYRVSSLHSGEPAIEFVVEAPLKRWGISDPFKGRIDLLVQDADWGGLWVWDHKNVRSIPNDDDRMMSPQNCMYVWALRKSGYDVRGFVYNYLRTKPPVIPRMLKRSTQYGPAGTLSQAQRMDTNYATYLQAIKDAHGEHWKEWAKRIYKPKLVQLKERDWMWFRRVPIPVEEDKIKQALAEFLVTIKDIQRRNLKYPPRSYTYTCRWGCEYHPLCVSSFAGLDIDDMIAEDYTFENERYSKSEDLLKD